MTGRNIFMNLAMPAEKILNKKGFNKKEELCL
mgnify:CR=1 FL=1